MDPRNSDLSRVDYTVIGTSPTAGLMQVLGDLPTIGWWERITPDPLGKTARAHSARLAFACLGSSYSSSGRGMLYPTPRSVNIQTGSVALSPSLVRSFFTNARTAPGSPESRPSHTRRSTVS